MKIKSIITLLLSLLTIISINAQGKEVEKYKATMDAVFSAFKNHDYELLKPLLDPNVKIGKFPTGMNDTVVLQMIEKLPVPESYSLVEVIKEGDNERVKTLYKFSDAPENRSLRNKSVSRTFLFNKEDKIIDLDIFDGVTAKTE